MMTMQSLLLALNSPSVQALLKSATDKKKFARAAFANKLADRK